MMRELEIDASRVDIHGLSYRWWSHNRALDMPARTSHAPGRRPRGLSSLTGLPQGKVIRAALLLQPVLRHAQVTCKNQLVYYISTQSICQFHSVRGRGWLSSDTLRSPAIINLLHQHPGISTKSMLQFHSLGRNLNMYLYVNLCLKPWTKWSQ